LASHPERYNFSTNLRTASVKGILGKVSEEDRKLNKCRGVKQNKQGKKIHHIIFNSHTHTFQILRGQVWWRAPGDSALQEDH
jgi:hypothetical protein